MNYKGKTVGINGKGGFISERLASALQEAGANVVWFFGDTRDPATFHKLNYSYDYFFHFAAPSSQVQFTRKAEFAIDTTINGFLNAARACRKHGVKLIYPSTGLLSSGRFNEYAMCKKICEDIAIGSKMDALGIRVFASYGPNENHKRDYASVPYLFARDMVNGKCPVIFGDGEQVRDFIYIDDVVQSILRLAEECNDTVVDVGSGVAHSFNDIVKLINGCLGYNLKPIYVEKPGGYVQETMADPSRLHDFYKPTVAFDAGIKKLVDTLIAEKGDKINA